MKKILPWIIVLVVGIVTLLLGYGYQDNQKPKTYYKVYLNDKVLGVIESEDKLLKFIDKESENIKNKYKVSKVYSPEGLYIETLTSYNETITSVEEIFNSIIKAETLRIDAYQVFIKSNDNNISFYVIDQNVLKLAIEEFIKTFVGGDNYNLYLKDEQSEIQNTGSIIENVYIQNDITVKKVKVKVDEQIYQTAQELSQFLLFGKDYKAKKYKVKLGDTIAKVAYDNEISTEEFLMSNPQFTDKNNLLHIGEEVNIIVTNPQMKVVMETYEIVDMNNAFIVEERIDPDKYVGDDEVIQEGENGIIRITQNVQTINGTISYIEPLDKVELKPVKNKIVIKGDKEIPNVGDLNNWAWPTLPGYTLTDDFEWRINPITGKREHHSGIDIAGTGYGSPVYAANNGTVITKKTSGDYGNYISINHNNGYYTLYAHMSRFAANISVGDTVSRGQIIGYVGDTGWATGPHLHFELWKDCINCRINPLTFYR